MINLHVVSLPLAQRLKELGVKQNSIFEWSTTESGQNIELALTLKSDHPNYNSTFYKSYSAYLASELGEMLPSHIIVTEKKREMWYWLGTSKSDDNEWHVHYSDDEVRAPFLKDWDSFKAETLADALALMLIHLKENNLLTT